MASSDTPPHIIINLLCNGIGISNITLISLLGKSRAEQKMEKSSGKSITSPTNSRPTAKIHSNVETPDSSIWVSCPYCCNLFEYAKDYENCRLRCQTCRRGFDAVAIPSPPPIVPGMDAYYCSWGCFPLGIWGRPSSDFRFGGFPSEPSDWKKSGDNVGFSSWKPFSPMFAGSFQEEEARTEQRDGSVIVNSREKPNEGTKEEPLFVVPINMRLPETKKHTIKKVRADEVCESSGNVGENMEKGNSVEADMGCVEKAGDFHIPVESVGGPQEAVKFHDDDLELDADVPSFDEVFGHLV